MLCEVAISCRIPMLLRIGKRRQDTCQGDYSQHNQQLLHRSLLLSVHQGPPHRAPGQNAAPGVSSKIPPEPTDGRHLRVRRAKQSLAPRRPFCRYSVRVSAKGAGRCPIRCTRRSGRFRPPGCTWSYAAPITAAGTRGRPTQPRRSRSGRRVVRARRFRASVGYSSCARLSNSAQTSSTDIGSIIGCNSDRKLSSRHGTGKFWGRSEGSGSSTSPCRTPPTGLSGGSYTQILSPGDMPIDNSGSPNCNGILTEGRGSILCESALSCALMLAQ